MMVTPSELYEERVDEQRGAHLVAKEEQIPVGTLLWTECPYTYTIFEEECTSVCHNCWKSAHLWDQPSFICSKCQRSSYCSVNRFTGVVACPRCDVLIEDKECSVAHEEIHAATCTLVSQLVSRIHSQYQLSRNRVRFMIALVLSQIDSRDMLKARVNDTHNCIFEDNVQAILKLKRHKQTVSDHVHTALFAAAQDLLESLPEKSKVLSAHNLVELSLISDTNAFGITLSMESLDLSEEELISKRPQMIPQFVVGMGLFSQSAKLNHSCYPSCQFDFKYAPTVKSIVLEMRAIKAIAHEQELTDSYIDLYLDRSARRYELLRTKNFFCQCERCIVPLAFSFDRYLNGKLCPKCSVSRLKETDSRFRSWSYILYHTGRLLAQQTFDMDDAFFEILRNVLGSFRCADLLQDVNHCQSPNFSPVSCTCPHVVDDPTWYPVCLEMDYANLWLKEMALKQGSFSTESSAKLESPSRRADFDLSSNGDSPLSSRFHSNQKKHNKDDEVAVKGKIPERHKLNGDIQEIDLDLFYASAKCEQCHHELDGLEDEERHAQARTLWKIIVSGYHNPEQDIMHTRKCIGLFFALFANRHLHPFHVWFYRASQRFVDCTHDLFKLGKVTAREYIKLSLVDIIFLRHQIACQKMGLPRYHEDTFTTLRVLIHVFGSLIKSCEMHQAFEADKISRTLVSHYNAIRQVLYK